MDEFIKHGFLLKKDFFSKEQISSVLKSAQDVFVPHLCNSGTFDEQMIYLFNKNIKTFINCGKVCQHSIPLHALGVESSIVNQLSDLGIFNPVISTRPVLFFNSRYLATKEIYYKTPAHQDWRSMQGSLNSIVVWVPLINVSKELGPLEVIPGSHKRGLCAKDLIDGFGICDTKDDEFISIEVKAGDALFFSSFLIHRSGDNISNNIRWSCHFRYNDLNECSYIKRGYPTPYQYRPLPQLITPNFPKKEDFKW